MSRPLVSVIVNVYDCERYVGEAVESVLAQTYRPFELIVVDDGSTDGSADRAAAYAGVQVLRRPHAGIGAARNAGVAAAAGEILAFLDADDRFTAPKLELQVAALERDPELDMVFGHVAEFVGDDLTPEQAARLREPVACAPWRMPNLVAVRREAFARVGGFSEELQVGVGVDWYARARDAGLRELVLEEVVLERRLHGDNNGVRRSALRPQYLHVLKASIDRRRRLAESGGTA